MEVVCSCCDGSVKLGTHHEIFVVTSVETTDGDRRTTRSHQNDGRRLTAHTTRRPSADRSHHPTPVNS